jgi:hypothetical protein
MPGQANSSQDLISKVTGAKWTESEAQMVKHLQSQVQPHSQPREKKKS